MLRGTPFNARTARLCQAQNWRRWSGYLVASSYELVHDVEYFAIRTTAALIDVSPLFKYRISGPDAARLLDRMVTRDVSRCTVHQVMYTPWCDERGKIIDDGTVARLDEHTFRLTAAEPTLRWLHHNATGLQVNITDESETIAALALQGPASRRILRQVVDADVDGVRYYRLTCGPVRGIPVTVTRTGYTGDLGYEIWMQAQHAATLWDTLVEAGKPHGLLPAGMLALDMARVEAGLILIEIDYISAHKALIPTQLSSPLELGLGWTVQLNKENFVGRSALSTEQEQGPAWQLVGLEVQWESLEQLYSEVGLPPQLPATTWRSSVPVYAKGKQVGYATSGCWSPLLKKYIALAHLEAEHAQLGAELTMEMTVEHRRKQAAVRVVKTPFLDPERKRA